MNKIDLSKKSIYNLTQNLLKDLCSIPFNLHNNNIIYEIFDKYSNKYTDEADHNKYDNFRDYFIKTWNK